MLGNEQITPRTLKHCPAALRKMKPAIRADRLSKQYRLGSRASAGYKTLRESVTNAPFAVFRRASDFVRGRDGACDSRNSRPFWALDDISFEVLPGEVVGIIGRNGAGKSTLLKILSRITEPTRGRAIIHGRVASLLEVGTGFHPELTGRENVLMNASILGMKRREILKKLDTIAAFAEIDAMLDTPVKRYSSGMYVRLAFSVAAHLDPDILIVDEVLAVGDVAFQTKCLNVLDTARRSGCSVLLVSHNTNTISRYSTTALLLNSGRLEYAGSPSDAVSRYLGGAEVGSSEWNTSDDLRHRSMAISHVSLAGSGIANGITNADTDFRVRVCFTVNRPATAQLAFRVNQSLDGTTVFTTAHSDASRSAATFFRPGMYHAECTVPGHFLRPGQYHLLVAINNPRGPQYDLIERAVDFTVSSAGSLVNHDRRLGACVPLLTWRICSA